MMGLKNSIMYFPKYHDEHFIHVAFLAKDPGLQIGEDESWAPESLQGEASLLTIGAFEEMIEFERGLMR